MGRIEHGLPVSTSSFAAISGRTGRYRTSPPLVADPLFGNPYRRDKRYPWRVRTTNPIDRSDFDGFVQNLLRVL